MDLINWKEANSTLYACLNAQEISHSFTVFQRNGFMVVNDIVVNL